VLVWSLLRTLAPVVSIERELLDCLIVLNQEEKKTYRTSLLRSGLIRSQLARF
jgi:hypothetical protein